MARSRSDQLPRRGERPAPCKPPLGSVASGHPEVSAAAAALLRSGGNAFDAALAAGFAAAVAEPMFTSLGGGGFLLARNAAGRSRLFDFFVDTPGRGLPAARREPHFVPVTVRFPSSEQIFNAGLGSVAVPGTLLGLLHVHRRLARRPLREVVAPAVRLARQGIALNGHQAYVQGLLEPINTLSPAGRELFAPRGRPLAEGERFSNPRLAVFLEALPEDAGRDLYAGSLARSIAAEMREGGGLLGEADLASYAVMEREPLAGDYRGCQLLTNPPPSLGGPLLGRALERLAAHRLRALGCGSAGHLEALASVMEEIERLDRPAAGGTTHVSVCDAEGNAASLSLSNGEGSGYLAPGTGIMLNNMLGEDDLHPRGFHAAPPGERVPSMMAPSLVLQRGRVRLIVGSGGSKRIRSALLQVISQVVDFERDVSTAVAAPRIHWDGECIQIEPGFAPAAREALQRSFATNAWPELNLYFGGVHAVDPEGGAAGDPRRAGHGLVVEDR